MKKKSVVISILGLPNSGKSTLINTLANKKVSITDDQPHTTRDYVTTNIEVDDVVLDLIDLPGYIDTPDEYLNIFQKNIHHNIDKSDLIFLVLDSKNPNQLDMDKLIKNLRRYSAKVWLLINKVDNFDEFYMDDVIYNYQFSKEFHISGYHKKGINLLIESIKDYSDKLNNHKSIQRSESNKLAIIGRPNVGKSSVFNSLLDYERSGVSSIPGTTLDVVSEFLTLEETIFEISDTAGIPRKRQKNRLERVGSLMSLKQIPISSVTLIVVDAKDGLKVEDIKLIYECIERNVTPIIVLNKWDLIENTEKESLEKDIKHELHNNNWISIVRTSTLNNRGIDLLELTIKDVYSSMSQRVKTSELNKFMRSLWLSKPPHPYRGIRAKLKYVNQYSTYPPAFSFQLKGNVPKNYRRYLVNQIRKEFNFGPTAIKVKF